MGYRNIFQKAIAIVATSRDIIIMGALRKEINMNTPVAINKLSEQIGLTSRTLRYWEEEGLFRSGRNPDSGWRTYDDEAVLCIKLTALLRKFDIPIKDIKAVLNNKTYQQMYDVLSGRISELSAQRLLNLHRENRLKAFLSMLQERNQLPINALSWDDIETDVESLKEKNMMMEEMVMSNPKIIVLPAMRTVSNVAVSLTPENEAMNPVFAWIKSSGLSGTARFFGFNAEPWSTGNQPYGYGMCATIPDGVSVPNRFKEMKIAGGMYMALESDDDIGGSWQKLMQHLSAHEVFAVDKTRPCFEEHTAIMKPDGSKESFCIILLEPVKRK